MSFKTKGLGKVYKALVGAIPLALKQAFQSLPVLTCLNMTTGLKHLIYFSMWLSSQIFFLTKCVVTDTIQVYT